MTQRKDQTRKLSAGRPHLDGTPAHDSPRERPVKVEILMLPSDKATLQEQAATLGITLSHLIRLLIKDK